MKAAAQHSSSELGSALALALHFALSIANDKTRVKNQINHPFKPLTTMIKKMQINLYEGKHKSNQKIDGKIFARA